MRRLAGLLAVAGLGLLFASWTSAGEPRQPPGHRQPPPAAPGDHPIVRPGMHQPPGHVVRPSAPLWREHAWRPPYLYPYSYSYPYPYSYAYPYAYPYYYAPPYYSGLNVLPPVWLPAESLYGPQAVRQFMGADALTAPRPNVNIIAPGGSGAQKADAGNQPKPTLRGTNREALELAWRHIGFGDADFENQKYSEANRHYRQAADVAPQVAEAYARQGYAMAALGRYDAAAKAFRRALTLDPDWPKSKFRNNEIYGGNQIAKKAHMDALAQAATKEPNDADLLFLVGLYLHFDGESQRAKPFFQKAGQLAGGDDAHLRVFP
jgi:tetratricopeptide (TPR) repeat protein